MKKILLLGSQHGDELLGDLLKHHIQREARHLLPYLTFKTANLKAKRKGVRFIERDMNRSYDGSRNTYEARRATLVSSYIRNTKFDLVLDLHTTNCVQPPSVIVHGLTPTKRHFLRASHITKVIDMRNGIVKNSLIGRHANSLSIEVSNRDLTTSLLDTLVHDLERYITNLQCGRTKELYIVKDLLQKSEVTNGVKLVNFQMNELGFIPILTGENSYKRDTNYLGFKASRTLTVKI